MIWAAHIDKRGLLFNEAETGILLWSWPVATCLLLFLSQFMCCGGMKTQMDVQLEGMKPMKMAG